MSDRAVVPPAPTVRWLVRPRLLERLAPIRDGGLGMVVAPVGSGKTTLLRQWARGRQHPVAWYAANRLPAPDAVLREASRRCGGIVVDDVHEATDPAHVEKLARIIDLACSQVPVVLGSRRLPRLNLARDELPRMVAVTSADLTFLPWEVAELFADVYEDPIEPVAVEALTERTEGWAAALRLWHLARRLGQQTLIAPPENPSPNALGGLPECLHDYVDREVLAGLPDPLLRFARAMSVFDAVTPERADRMLGTTGSRRALGDLARRVQLVVPMGEVDSYRFHRVLREHLRAGLAVDHGTNALRAMFDEAAVVLTAEGAHAEAFRARCRGGNAAEAANLLAGHGGAVLGGSPEVAALLAGSFAAATPSLLLALAHLLDADGSLERAATVSDLAVAAGADAARSTGGLPRTDPLAYPLTELALPSGDGLPLGRRAAASGEPAGHALRSIDLLAAGRARDALAQLALAQPHLPPDHPVLLAARLGIVAARAIAAPTEPEPELTDIYRLARGSGLTWLARLAYAAALVRGANPRRCAEARRLAAARHLAGDRWAALLIDAAVGVALLRQGRPDLALLESLVERCRALGAGTLEAAARALHALAAAESDAPDAGEARAAEAFARHAEAPAALAVAYAALALREPGRRTDLMRLAESTGALAGLGCRPWTWRRDSARAIGEERPPRSGPPPSPAKAPRAGETTRHTLAEPEPTLTMTCLGDFQLRLDGRPVDLSRIRPVAQTVLRILAVHAGTTVHREIVVTALWGDLREGAALHNVHVAISSLRQLLGTLVPGRARTLLARTGQAYALAPSGPPLTDLQAIDARLAQATRCRLAGDRTGHVDALREVLDGYVADVLPADGSAEWVLPTRERYRQTVAEAATTLADVELRRGRFDAAVHAATGGVRIDPWRDATWRVLIAAHDAAGAPAAASRARQEYAAMLESLGVASVATPNRTAAGAPRPAPTVAAKAARPPGVRTA
ncbi:MAG: BTAD domain-containing putative transcriptional regulator [Dermatophilaceae bacterium]